jgi:hypothetical protein
VESGPNYWAWVAITALLGWLITSITLWRSRSGASRPAAASVAAPQPNEKAAPPPPSPAELAAAVRDAYQRKDPFAAKEALLKWGACAWPADPPNNLSRLAARCPPVLQRQVLKLDEALYSPGEVNWSEFPVWEHLQGPGNPPEAAPLPARG